MVAVSALSASAVLYPVSLPVRFTEGTCTAVWTWALSPVPRWHRLSHHIILFPLTARITKNLFLCKAQILQLFSSYDSAQVLKPPLKVSFCLHISIPFHLHSYGLAMHLWCILHGRNLTSCRDQWAAQPYLEGYLSCHSESVCNDRLFLSCSSFPAVQLHTAAAWQKHLPIHLHRWVTGQLSSYNSTRIWKQGSNLGPWE